MVASADEGPPAAPPGPQRCCLGLTYYSQALEAEGKRPVCLGLPHTPSERVSLSDAKQLRQQAAEFKFMCLGHAMYEAPPGAASSSQQQQRPGAGREQQQHHHHPLPYCEGLELILASTADAAASAAEARSSAEAGQQGEELSAVLTSMFGGEESPLVKGAAKFNKIASRNWDRMKASAGQAYSITLKPLIDKLSGDQ